MALPRIKRSLPLRRRARLHETLPRRPCRHQRQPLRRRQRRLGVRRQAAVAVVVVGTLPPGVAAVAASADGQCPCCAIVSTDVNLAFLFYDWKL